jgi:hypothetical protein
MRKVAVLMTVCSALAATATALAGSTGGKATGGINHTTVAGFEAHRSFNAQGTPEAAKGQVETKIVDATTGQLIRKFHGVVDCYQPIDNKTARFSGFVTNVKFGEEDVEGDYFRWTVRDNGEGRKAPPDEFIAERFMTKPQAECTVGAVPTLEAVNGNIQVHRPK